MTASAAEVKLAFRRKALALHPDVNSAPDASERFQQVSQAYGEVFRSPLFRVYVCPHGIFICGALPAGQPGILQVFGASTFGVSCEMLLSDSCMVYMTRRTSPNRSQGVSQAYGKPCATLQCVCLCARLATTKPARSPSLDAAAKSHTLAQTDRHQR